MSTKTKIIGVVALFIVTVVATLIGSNWWTRATDKKKRAEYDAAAAVSKQINDKLRVERDAAIKAGDDAEQRALEAHQKIAGLEAEFAKFGAAGAAAVKRQEDAAKKYEAEKTSIRASTDACALCRNLCSERAAQSTADNDVSCAANYCDQYCAVATASPGP